MDSPIVQSEQTPEVKKPPRVGMIGQVWSYLKIRKKWWLAPIFILLLLFGLLLVFAQTSPLAPFIYTIF